tara:strand:- start:674 stop:862 length:189 start_codon:yes stop_codon:yes gene_type:complete
MIKVEDYPFLKELMSVEGYQEAEITNTRAYYLIETGMHKFERRYLSAKEEALVIDCLNQLSD